MDQERDQERHTYAICRAGFGILSFALLLACLTTILSLTGLFMIRFPLGRLTKTAIWHWRDVPIVWGSLLGCYLLWGRWSHAGWQRRSGLLVMMCLVDTILWFLDHGGELGLYFTEVGHEWLRGELGVALGWAEFALIASLAGDLMAHLGVEQAPEAGKATRSLAATGAVVWLLFFFEQTAWHLRWPLKQRGIGSIEAYLLFLGYNMIWTITLIQVTALTIATSRQAGRVLAEMEREDQDDDLLKPPSDAHLSLLSRDFEEF